MAIKILYEKIREKRNQLELSQQDLSNETDVNVNIIKSLETGRSNTTKTNMKKIAKRLDLDLNEIYFEDFRDTKMISIANNKGGSAKTSTVSSLAYALSEIDDNRILLIDGCMQMNLSNFFGFLVNKEYNLGRALRKEMDLSGFIQKTKFDNIDIIVSDYSMATIEMDLFNKTLRESLFKRHLKSIVNSGVYDYILIDTNPTLGMVNFNILNASDYVLIPVNMAPFALNGLDIILGYIETVKEINEDLKVLGILRTIYDKRESMTEKIDDELMDVTDVRILNTRIDIDTNMKKAQYASDPTYTFKLNTRSAKQYRDLAKEVIRLVK